MCMIAKLPLSSFPVYVATISLMQVMLIMKKKSQQYLLIATCNVHWAMFYFVDKFLPLWYSFPMRSLLLCWSKFYSTIKVLFCPFISQSLVFLSLIHI